jgi:hypothetical protein
MTVFGIKLWMLFAVGVFCILLGFYELYLEHARQDWVIADAHVRSITYLEKGRHVAEDRYQLEVSYEGIVDLCGIIADGDLFAPIRHFENFKNVRVASYGHSLYWGNEDNEAVDFGSDRLRELAEEQAALLACAS